MGKNIEYIGLSSGKFSTYMMLGLPTIARNIEPYISLNTKYSFGALIDSPRDIDTAIVFILNNYDRLSSNSRLLYNSELTTSDLSYLI